MEKNINRIDQELITRLKNGDMLAFDQVYEQYSHKLFSFVFKILKNGNDAEEIVQEVFVKIWESRHNLGSCKLFNSYIFTIAYNHSISLIRKKINNKKYLEYLKYSSVNNSIPSSVSEIEFIELSNQVERLIENLPERQKQIYRLHREKGFTYPEIADQLEISKNTVEKRDSLNAPGNCRVVFFTFDRDRMTKELFKKYLQGNCSTFNSVTSFIFS